MRPPAIVSKNRDNKNNKSKPQPKKEQICLDVNTLCQNLDLSKTTLRDVLSLLETKYGGIKLDKTLRKIVKELVIENVTSSSQSTTKKSNNNNKNRGGKNVPVDAQWMQFYNEAKQFIIEHGHFKIPNNRRVLQKWMKTQKKSYIKFHERKKFSVVGINLNNNNNNTNEPKLTRTQVQLLDELGISWNSSISVRSSLTWVKKYEELEQYLAEHGTTDVTEDRNHLLYNWTRAQRKKYLEMSLTRHQIKMLNDLNFNWQYKESQLPGPEWVKMYEAAIKSKIQNHDAS